jgi:hypothetical protein
MNVRNHVQDRSKHPVCFQAQCRAIVKPAMGA